MFYKILQLIMLISCVRGMLEHHYMGLSYQAEENSDITVEWRFSSQTNIPISSLKIHCQLVSGRKVFFHLDDSYEESQHEQFEGRVWCDEDALRAGRVRLHVSRVQTEDAGLYLCRMVTGSGKKVKRFKLDITPAIDEPQPLTPPVTPPVIPSPESRGRISLYAGLGLAAAAVAVLAVCRCASAPRPARVKEEHPDVVFEMAVE